MATIKDTPGDLVIIDTPAESVCIRRSEPSRAERILGVCMTGTDQRKTEHSYRLEQVNIPAVRIRCVPLLCIEAKAA